MSSRYSFDSLDHLWADERRLSEAGVRRSSTDSAPLYDYDSSDSFIIGDRVYVGGTIPGKIAYIGETKFGPGDWAGIVLDEATGKNDGTVGGFRYFQCEPKHGIFSRLSRLTRSPLLHLMDRPTSRNSSVDEGRYSPFKKSSIDEGRYSPFKKSSISSIDALKSSFDGLHTSRKSSNDSGGLFSRNSSDGGGLYSRKSSGDSYSGRKSSGSNTTYVPMSYSGRESPERYSGRESPTGRRESPVGRYSSGLHRDSSPHYGGSPAHHHDYYGNNGSSPAKSQYQSSSKKSQSNEVKIGDRVIIRSSQGSKSGVLKYKGDTYFAQGEWCGVELDDPLGKNDGSVDGVRYFYCEPKFGVFAPLSKVSKSPIKTTHVHKNCVVHPNKDIPIVSTVVKEVKPAPGSRPFMDKTTTIVYEKKAPRGAKAVTQIHQIKGYNHSWDADCY
uniref:CAP-Gly domain-containing linker protein 4 n=2 Tax=Cacopsylla melanoneura TaxID=428564 RepID=A0A8D8QN21_9HEMI